MSTKTAPNTPAAMTKLPLIMGFVCFVVGALTLLYAGFAVFRRTEQLKQNELNLQRLESAVAKTSNSNSQALKEMKILASNAFQMAQTNRRSNFVLCGISALTVAAGGVLLFTARPRK